MTILIFFNYSRIWRIPNLLKELRA